MLDVSSFLLRWLFLCNLVRDVADIQNLPYTPRGSISGNSPYEHLQQSSSQILDVDDGVHWRDFYLRGIMAYPPGMQRLLAMDALRIEVVHRLSQHLEMSHNILRRAAEWRRKQQCQHRIELPHQQRENPDVYWDEDVEILKTLGQPQGREQPSLSQQPQPQQQHVRGGDSATTTAEEGEAVLIINDDGIPNVVSSMPPLVEQEQDSFFNTSSPIGAPSPDTRDINAPPTPEEIEQARRAMRDMRDYLPQLVSVVLKSPPPFEPALSNPIHKLRELIIQRCSQDANWGIELCWLLEAEVGRAWKTLFEHRQQTGRRLIVVLPAEKAVVMAKIGAERREAFDLLQDAEQATAYGYTVPPPAHQIEQHLPQYAHGMMGTVVTPQDESSSSSQESEVAVPSTRLPSSLSLRRCSHFGDTMQFVDRLTQISMDLRLIPAIQRHSYLQEQLHEMNRRIRRRMITRGDVSLDVEDSGGPDDWPRQSDLTLDMLKHSVHLPMEPKAVIWPSGKHAVDACEDNAGVVRVLNIIVPESRLLASRERCPYLIHVEVADTALDGSDARLYASGANGLGTTIEEALGMGPTSVERKQGKYSPELQCPAYEIPPELLSEPSLASSSSSSEQSLDDGRSTDSMSLQTGASQDEYDSGISIPVARGGWQGDDGGAFYPEPTTFEQPSTPYEDLVRQEEYEELHQQIQVQQDAAAAVAFSQMKILNTSTVTLGTTLLDRIFGTSWAQKCEELRQASAFGNVPGWRLASFIMKAGEDIRREALVMQVITKLNGWFQTDIPEEHRPFMRPYTIMCVGGDAGIIECLSDAKSVDEVKKRTDGYVSLRDYFERAYGPPRRRTGAMPDQNIQQQPPRSREMMTFERAQDNFLRSLVGYSLVCYVLQIKDRHNANILMDREGHIMHIDFGFVLGDTPKMGKVPIFSERAPFKLSADFWEVLGGWNIREGGLGVKFCKMFERAFECASSHADEIVTLVEASLLTICPNPQTARALANGVRSRLRMRGPPGSFEQKSFVVDLVNAALTSWGTSTYDWLQKNMNGYQ